jgi:glucose-6-phosphate dehydrogenase assembly protein OpcA
MAAAVDRAWRASSPQAIDADMSALWREIGERGPIARAMMSNLVVFRRAHPVDLNAAAIDDAPSDIPVSAVAAQHPCRAIVIDHTETEPRAAQSVSAEGAIVVFGPPSARYGIEQIAIRAACPAASLPSIVRRLVRGDLPTSVWWADDLSRVAPDEAIVTMSRQLVYDSSQWRDVRRGILALAPYVTMRDASTPSAERTATDASLVDLADVNWRRLNAVRRALIVAADSGDAAVWQPANIRITHRPGDYALAWLLAGWLASRLNWRTAETPRIDERGHGDDILSVVIGEGSGETQVTLDAGRVVVTRTGSPPSAIGVPREGEADAVAAELHSLAHDACLHDALSALLRSFRAA